MFFQLTIIKQYLGDDEYTKYEFCAALLHRPIGVTEGSVGLLLSEPQPTRISAGKQHFAIEVTQYT